MSLSLMVSSVYVMSCKMMSINIVQLSGKIVIESHLFSAQKVEMHVHKKIRLQRRN